mgnify:CR=1 FL=1
MLSQRVHPIDKNHQKQVERRYMLSTIKTVMLSSGIALMYQLISMCNDEPYRELSCANQICL